MNATLRRRMLTAKCKQKSKALPYAYTKSAISK